jgi:membrane-associated phospholipid phosphatase
VRAGELDRRAGALAREAAGRVPGAERTARVIAASLSPAFRALVAVLLLRPETRRTGVGALAAGVLAATAARLVRDRLGRPRPGERRDAGFPSRHAAAAVAIAGAVGRERPAAGRALSLAAAVGLAARVVSGAHEPADVAAGAALGWATTRIVERVVGRG